MSDNKSLQDRNAAENSTDQVVVNEDEDDDFNLALQLRYGMQNYV